MAIDAGEAGDLVYAIMDGTVVFAGWTSDYGNTIMVEHDINGEKFYSVYGHLGQSKSDTGISVNVGDSVDPSTQIGTAGATKPYTDKNGDYYEDGLNHSGSGAHLHFEVRKAANVNLAYPTYPFMGEAYWGYNQATWHDNFVDLGVIYGYNADYAGMK